MKILIIGIAFGLVIVVSVALAVAKERKIEKYGIEVDALVTRIESRYDYDSHKTNYYPYAEYVGDDNEKHEARVNVSINFPIGRKLKIKFLPSKYDYVIFVSQQIDESMDKE